MSPPSRSGIKDIYRATYTQQYPVVSTESWMGNIVTFSEYLVGHSSRDKVLRRENPMESHILKL